jgi:hypothetical protein
VVIDLDAIEKAAKAATPGSWTHSERRPGGVIYAGPFQQFTNGKAQSQIFMACGADWMEPGQVEKNAKFVAETGPVVVLELIRLARDHDNAKMLAVIDELSEQNRHLAFEAKTNATRHLEVASELRLAKLSLDAKIEKLPPIVNGDTVIVKTNDIRSRDDALMLAQLIRRVSPPSTSMVFVSAETEIEAIHEDTMELRGWVRAERAVGPGRTDVDTKALRQVLAALTCSDGHRIRELQAIMALPDSPIRVLVDQVIEKSGGKL